MPIAVDGALNKGASGATATGTTISTTIGTVTSGGTAFAFVSWEHASATASLSGGSTWTQQHTHVVGSRRLALFTAPGPITSGTSITATFTASSTYRFLGFVAFTGLATPATPHGTPATNSFTTTAWTGGSVTTTVATALSLGFAVSLDDSSSATPATNWTEVYDMLITGSPFSPVYHVVYRILSATGAYNAGGTFDSAPPSASPAFHAVFAEPVAGGAVQYPYMII